MKHFHNCFHYFLVLKAENQPDELLHKGVAVVGSVRASVAIKYSKVQHAVVNPSNAETVLVLFSKTHSRWWSHPRQTDLREEGLGSTIRPDSILHTHPTVSHSPSGLVCHSECWRAAAQVPRSCCPKYQMSPRLLAGQSLSVGTCWPIARQQPRAMLRSPEGKYKGFKKPVLHVLFK